MPSYVKPQNPYRADSKSINRQTRILCYDVDWGRPYASLDYAQIVIASNPLGFWRFDTNDTSVFNYGTAGATYNGTYNDTPDPLDSAVGLCDGAASFDGSQYLNCGALKFAATSANLNFAFSMWVHPTRTPASKDTVSEILLSKGNTTGGSFRVLLDNNNFVVVQVYTGGAWTTLLTSAEPLQVNKWSFIAASVRPGEQFLQVDYNSVVTNNVTTMPTEGDHPLIWAALLNAGVPVNNSSITLFTGGLDEGVVYKSGVPKGTFKEQLNVGLSRSYYEPLQDIETAPVSFQQLPGTTYKNYIEILNPKYYFKFDENAGVTSVVNNGSEAITATYAGADILTSVITPGATIDTASNPKCRKFSGRGAEPGYFQSYMVTATPLNLGTAGSRTAASFGFWYKRLADSSNWDDIFGVQNAYDKHQGFTVSAKKGKVRILLYTPDGEYRLECPEGYILKDTTGIARDRWYYIMFTISTTGRVRMYVNGQPVDIDVQLPDRKGLYVPDKDLTNAYFKIGKLKLGKPHPGFALDELHIHTVELTSQQAYIAFMSGKYGSSYGSKIISQGSDGVTEPTYEISCNDLAELTNERDITSYIEDWSIEYDDKQLVTGASLKCREGIETWDLDAILEPNTYVKIQARHTNAIDGDDSGWIDEGHFLVEGPAIDSNSGAGDKSLVVILKGMLKLVSLDIVPSMRIEPDRLFVSRRPLKLTNAPVTYYEFKAERPDVAGTYYYNLADKPDVRLWVTKLNKTSGAQGDAKEANEIYAIRGAQGSVDVQGGTGAIRIDKEFFEASVKDVGLGQPDTDEGVLAEFHRFCNVEDVADNVPILGIGYDGRYYLRVDDDGMEHVGKTLLVKDGAAAGKMFKVVDQRKAYLDGDGNLGNYDSGVAIGTFDTYTSVTRVGSTIAWGTPEKARLRDDVGAYAGHAHTVATSYTHYLKGVNPTYDSVIPEGASIKSIKLKITRKANASSTPTDIQPGNVGSEEVYDEELFLVKGGTIQTGATNKAATSADWQYVGFGTASYGGTVGDMWGVTGGFTTADIYSGFGFALAAEIVTQAGGLGNLYALVDTVVVEIAWELFTLDAGGSGTGGETGYVNRSVRAKFVLAIPEQYMTGRNFYDTGLARSLDGNSAYATLKPDPGSPVVFTQDGKGLRMLRPEDDFFYAIPVGSKLRGISIEITRSGNVNRASQSGGYAYNWIEDKQVKLVWHGLSSGSFADDLVGTDKKLQGYSNSWGGPAAHGYVGSPPYVPPHRKVVYGGSTDLWGLDTDPATMAIYEDPFAVFCAGAGTEYFGVQFTPRAQFENSFRPYMQAEIDCVELVAHLAVPAGSVDAGGGEPGVSTDFVTSGFSKLYIRGLFGHIVSPAYEDLEVGNLLRIGDDNAVEMTLTKIMLFNDMQMRDSSKPFYFELDAPQMPGGIVALPKKFKLSESVSWVDVMTEVMAQAPGNYMVITFPDGITRAVNNVQKILGSSDYVIPSYSDFAQDSTDFATYNRTIAEGIGGDSVNVALHKDYAGQAAVRAYHLKNFFNPDDPGSDNGLELTQAQANAVMKGVFDNSVKTPGPTNPTVKLDDVNYGLIYQLSSDDVTRWYLEGTPMFCLDIGRDPVTNKEYLIEALSMIFIDTYRQDKGGRKILQRLSAYVMTEADYMAEFGKYPPETPDQDDADNQPLYMSALDLTNTNATYFPPSNARSWRLLIDSFICQDAEFTIEAEDFIDEEPMRFRFLKIVVDQTHYAYAFGGTASSDYIDSKTVARVNIADIKLHTSRKIVAVATLGQAPTVGLDTGYHKRLTDQYRRRSLYIPFNPYLTDFTLAQTQANNELLERYREFRPAAITSMIPSAFPGDTIEVWNRRLGRASNYIIRSMVKNMLGQVTAQVADYDPIPTDDQV